MIKWIGEHIWDFVSRFRNDIYMESIPDGTIASGKNLVKSSSPSGSIDLTSEVTGTLPVANGGTGATSLNNLITLSTHTTGDYVASLTAGSLIDLQNNTGEGATPIIDVDLSELTDMTESWTTAEDEFVVLDNGTQKRKLSSEIFGSNAFTSTTILDTEAVQDIVGGMFSGNTETRISATYQDGDGTIDLVADDMTANTMGSGFTVSATTDTTATTITEGDDLFFAAGTGISCETTADGTVTITNTVSDTNTQLTDEQVQDIVGGMFSGNTETRISATYQDGDGTIDLVVDDMTANDNTTYSISCVDGDNSDEEKIRLTDSGGTTDDVVLEAGTGLSIARSSDKITFTNTVAASTDVTLTGTPDYITISGQEITRNQIDLAADVTGVLPSANLDSDTAHLSGSQTFTGTKTFNHIRPMVIEHSDPGTGVGDFKAADVAFFGGTTGMTTGKCYYLNDSGGWTITNADAEADASGLLAIALGDESDVDGMLLRGMVTPFALAGTDDYGKKVYLREQDGVLTTSIPTTSGSIVRIVGYMLHDSDDAIFFCPDNTYVELA